MKRLSHQSNSSCEANLDGDTPAKPDWRQLGVRERLALIPEIFLYTPDVTTVLTKLTYCLHNPRPSGPGRVVLVTGPASAGKTSIIRKFEQSNAVRPTDRIDERPVVITTPTACVDASNLAEAIIRDAKWPLRSPLHGHKLPEMAVQHVLRESGARMLIINRAMFLTEGRRSIEYGSIPFLTALIDSGVATMVLVGNDVLPAIIDQSPLASRCSMHLRVGPVSMREDGDCPWQKLLRQYESQLPFEDGALSKGDMPQRLSNATRGLLPALTQLVESAAMIALYEEKPPSKALLSRHFAHAFAHYRPNEVNPFGASVPLTVPKPQTLPQPITELNESIDRIRSRNRRQP